MLTLKLKIKRANAIYVYDSIYGLAAQKTCLWSRPCGMVLKTTITSHIRMPCADFLLHLSLFLFCPRFFHSPFVFRFTLFLFLIFSSTRFPLSQFWPLKVCCLLLYRLFSPASLFFCAYIEQSVFGVIYLNVYFYILYTTVDIASVMWMINKTENCCSKNLNVVFSFSSFLILTWAFEIKNCMQAKRNEYNFGNGNLAQCTTTNVHQF